jgi:hypothetical protein
MLFVSLVGLAVMFVLIGVGIVLGVAAVGLTALLVGAGVLSSSVAIGLWRGRAQSGLRALFIQCGLLVGVPAGMLCAWLSANFFAHADAALVRTLLAGGIGGAISGLVVAWLLDFVARRVQVWLVARDGRAYSKS